MHKAMETLQLVLFSPTQVATHSLTFFSQISLVTHVCQLYYLPETVVRRSPISLKMNNILFTHFRNGWHADSSFLSSPLRSPKVCLLDLCLEILHAEKPSSRTYWSAETNRPRLCSRKPIGCRTPGGQVLNAEEPSFKLPSRCRWIM